MDKPRLLPGFVWQWLRRRRLWNAAVPPLAVALGALVLAKEYQGLTSTLLRVISGLELGWLILVLAFWEKAHAVGSDEEVT